jgi:hypothetical protein
MLMNKYTMSCMKGCVQDSHIFVMFLPAAVPTWVGI